jgi:galactonate dehydratase
MEVTDYELFEVPPRWLFLKVETDSGIVGWGEPVLEGRAQTATTAVRELLENYLVGEDPAEIERHWQQMYRGGFYRGGPILMSALSGIDQALWDIKGKRHDLPVYELLGGKARDRVRLYDHFGGSTPEEVAESARASVENGFSMIKSGPSVSWRHVDSPATIEETRALVRAAREAVGDDVDIALDFHGRLSVPMAKRVVAELEQFAPMFYEEPVVPEKNGELSRIASKTTVPIATGERMYTRWEFAPVLENGAVDVVQPDVSHAGGITELRKIAAIAEVSDAAVAPHSPLGAVALAACLQVDACTHNAIVQEQVVLQDDVPTYLNDDAVFDHDDGYVDVPTGPGLGVDVDESALRDAAEDDAWEVPPMRHDDGSVAEW